MPVLWATWPNTYLLRVTSLPIQHVVLSPAVKSFGPGTGVRSKKHLAVRCMSDTDHATQDVSACSWTPPTRSSTQWIGPTPLSNRRDRNRNRPSLDRKR